MRRIVFTSLLATAVFGSGCQRRGPPAPQQIVVGPASYSLEVQQPDGKVTSLSASEPIAITPSGIFQGVFNLDAGLDPGNKLTIKAGAVVANGQDGGQVKPGDSVRLDKEGRLFVNGEERSLKPMPQPPADPNGNRVISVTGGNLNMFSGGVTVSMPVPGVPLKVVDQDGSAALQFEHWILLFEGVPAKSVPVGVSTSGWGANLLVNAGERRTLTIGGQTIESASSPPAALTQRFTLSVAGDGSTSAVQQQTDEPTQPGRLDVWLDNRSPNAANPQFGWTIQKAQIGELKVSSWDQNSICVNGCTCKFEDGGKQLVCPDHTYETAETPKTIIISKKGTTREQADQ